MMARHLADVDDVPGIEVRHLFRGLLEDADGLAARLLLDAGLNSVGLEKIRGSFPTLAMQPVEDFVFHQDGWLEKALHDARELAHELSGEHTVASNHLLLALLRSHQHLVDELEPLGFAADRLEVSAQPPPRLVLEEPLALSEPEDVCQTARILDVNGNRAREAIRVVEDFSRFVLNDRFLCSQWKQLRHDLTGIIAQLPGTEMLAARDTLGDVGTDVTTAGERERISPRAVAEANLKRLQESLRSMEEFAKIRSPKIGEAVERLRYQSYTLERAVLLGATARDRLADARLYVLVSAAGCAATLDWTIAEAAAGGAQIVQLREKGLDDRTLLSRARQVRRLTEKAGVLFIINDRPDLARLSDADGVHLGQEDMSVADARRIVGPDALIGVSTHNLDQLRQAVLEGASYIGIGPTFPSGTKSFRVAGVEFVRQALEETSLPAFAIGGVNQETVAAAVAVGARRVAVSQAICSSADPRAVATALRAALR
jgi:thiamine-phosphate pyrophosphorylase